MNLAALLAFLQGKKTFIMAGGYVALAAFQFFVLKDATSATSSLMMAGSLLGLRSAINTAVVQVHAANVATLQALAPPRVQAPASGYPQAK